MNSKNETINGVYLTINQGNHYFNEVTIMLLEYYDTPEFKDSVIILGSNLEISTADFRLQYPGKKIIIYQLEQLVDCNHWWNPNYVVSTLSGADEIWDYDILNIKYCEMYFNMKNIKFVPLRYTESLKEITDGKHDIDILYYGSLSERRMKWLLKVRTYFWWDVKIWIVGGNTKDQLKELISRSKIILNIHTFEPYSRQEQVRMFYPLINGKCILSETSQANHMEGCITETSYDNICSDIQYLLSNDRYKTIAADASSLYTMQTHSNEAYEIYKQNIINRYA